MDRSPKTTVENARHFFLQKQLLSGGHLPPGKTGVLRVIEKLGYVQIDTINVVARSHHIVIFTRCPDYRESNLDDLLAKDRGIFEYWAHEASYIPLSDYRYYLPAMKKKPKSGSWLGRWIKQHRELLKKVKNRIIKEGPLTAGDFQNSRRNKGGWWSWKSEKLALEVLFWRGELMISERKKFQRVYDLTERVLPRDVDNTMPADEEIGEFFVRRALKALGVATIQEINRYIKTSGKLDKYIDPMLKRDQIVIVQLEERTRTYYALKEDVPDLTGGVQKRETRVNILSPFDNAIIQRERTSDLFNFDYRLECYVPKNKRVYGYFCMPILWRDKFVGLIDPRADRDTNTLVINNIYLEAPETDSPVFLRSFTRCLEKFAGFNNCSKIKFNRRDSAGIVKKIKRHLQA